MFQIFKAQLFLSLTGLIISGSPVFASGVLNGGGGGHAVVCRDSSGAIRGAELLDLFEAQNVAHIAPRPAKSNLDEEFIAYFEARGAIQTGKHFRMSSRQRANALDYYRRSLKLYWTFVATLPSVDDFGQLPAIPYGCALEQLAVFKDSEPQLYVNREIWDALTLRSRVGLWAHEFYWRQYRVAGDLDSIAIRKIVGWIFADRPLFSTTAGVPRSAKLCQASGADLSERSWFYTYADPSDSKRTVFQFATLFGRDSFSPVKIRVANTPSLRNYIDQVYPVQDSPLENYFVEVRTTGPDKISLALYDSVGRSLGEESLYPCQ